MPHHQRMEIVGTITDVFAHRFVVESKSGRVLADLGPEGAKAFRLSPGLEVVVEGEMKPSELKADRIALKGSAAVTIEHKKKPPHPHGADAHGHHPHAEPGTALAAVRSAGYTPLGEPRRKPKHFEVLARQDDRFVECHVELDGHIRKEKPVAPHDHKWADELTAA